MALSPGTRPGPYEMVAPIGALKKARDIDERMVAPLVELAHAYAASDQRAEARRALEELLARSQRGYVSKYVVALVYAALGDKDEALARLNQACAEGSYFLLDLKVEPELDSLRPDPRFQAPVRRMNFPQ
jgi:tetratricopeptide (TPR) repeat protein